MSSTIVNSEGVSSSVVSSTGVSSSVVSSTGVSSAAAITGPPPTILDVDGSVLPVHPDETRLSLASWQEAVRFSCTRRGLQRFEDELRAVLPANPGVVFMGSGDFHHLTLPLLRLLHERQTFAPRSVDVLVLDNHPDAMHFPFGVHCGSWVGHAARLPWVRRVHVAGITSPDITAAHAWEMQLSPLLQRKLVFWSVGVRARWLRLIGRSDANRTFPTADELVSALTAELLAARESEKQTAPALYVSIDKDVFAPEVARTNWDQGVFSLRHVETLLAACAGHIAGADITGEASVYAFQHPFKRFLIRLEDQPALSETALEHCRAEHRALNAQLLPQLRLR